MKVVKVNPKANTVELIELNGGEDDAGTLEDWYREVECTCVAHFYLYHLGLGYDLMFIMDDEGMFKDEKAFWQLPECMPITGNALIYAINPNTVDVMDFTGDLELLKTKIKFLHKKS